MVSIKSQEEIEIMAEGGKILAGVMAELEKKIRPGIATKELNELAEELIFESGGKPSFKGYGGFPAALCTSINEEIVHAVPSERTLKEGDIVSLDLGLEYKGFHTDMARSLAAGKAGKEVLELIKATKEALSVGIREVRPGNTFGDIGYAIQKYVESKGFGVIRELCGHGIGKELHEDPQILNYSSRAKSGKEGPALFDRGKIKEGMVLCLEPMVASGDWAIARTADRFGFRTKDGSLSCHFEDTVAVTKNGAKILTACPVRN